MKTSHQTDDIRRDWVEVTHRNDASVNPNINAQQIVNNNKPKRIGRTTYILAALAFLLEVFITISLLILASLWVIFTIKTIALSVSTTAHGLMLTFAFAFSLGWILAFMALDPRLTMFKLLHNVFHRPKMTPLILIHCYHSIVNGVSTWIVGLVTADQRPLSRLQEYISSAVHLTATTSISLVETSMAMAMWAAKNVLNSRIGELYIHLRTMALAPKAREAPGSTHGEGVQEGGTCG